MKKFPNIINWLMLAGVVVFISFLYPEKAVFKYEYQLGYTWKYDDLVAPFDFAIKRSEEAIQTEIDSLEEEFHPYFVLDKSLLEEKIASYEEELARQKPFLNEYDDVHTQYEALGSNLLENVYEKGILDRSRYDSILAGRNRIQLISGKRATTRQISSFYALSEARQYITNNLKNASIQSADIVLPILTGLVEPNVYYNDSLTQIFYNELIGSVPKASGMVKKGELIVPSGGVIDGEIKRKLDSFRDKYVQEAGAGFSRKWVAGAYILLTTLIMLVYFFYVTYHDDQVFKHWKNMLFALIWFVIYAYLVFLVEKADVLSAYLIPFCIVPILLKNFFNDRLAFFTHVCVVLVASFLTSLDFEFTLLHILAGAVAVLSDTQTRDWNRFFTSIGFILLTYVLGYTGLSIIHSGNVTDIQWQTLIWLCLNAFLLLLAYPLIPLLERIFGFTSSISLAELSDLNRPLLKELSITAPGTFQHSLQVANLAEAAADAVGANSLLVKVGALYHDIGKMKHPRFFVENQQGENPHEGMDPKESAEIIIAHVTDGAEMARKKRLPKVLIDFILTHHGTTRVAYFYHQEAEEKGEERVKLQDFQYPGPKPRSKEEGILMMADSLEASSKSLQNPTGHDIDQLMDKIISGKLKQGQFDECRLTFKEMETCKEIFKKVLRSIHHVRVEYPEEAEEKTG